MTTQKMTLLLIVCGLALSGYSQKSANDEIQLKALVQDAFDHIFSERAPENIPDYFTEDFILLEHGELWNNDTISVHLSAARERPVVPLRENRFEYIKFDIDGDRAWVAYYNYATFLVNGEVTRQAKWLESVTAIRSKEGWKLSMMHSTRCKLN